MKKKFGFTLAEVLITLGIIGVVAALTAPALVKNSGQAKIGPALAKFVNTFETGIEAMMTEENMSTLKNNVGGSMILLSRQIVMTPISEGNDKKYNFTDAEGTNSYNLAGMADDIIDKILNMEDCVDVNGDGECDVTDAVILADYGDATTAWQLKDGSIVQITPLRNFTPANKGAYKGVVAEVIVDIDGNKASNRAGKDVFAFLLDASGILIPAGSNAHKFIEQNGAVYIKAFDNDCKTDDVLSHNFACTGKIADNGWKADY